MTFVQAVDLSVQGDECAHRHRDSFLAAGDGDLEWLPGRKQARLRRPGRSVQTAQLMMCRLRLREKALAKFS
jgi:hypothetical protein